MIARIRPFIACAAAGVLMFAAGDCFAATVVDYSGKSVTDKEFKDGVLNGANFSGADAHNVNFSNATLKGANFTKANLQNANFSKAVLDDADFTGADLKSVTWTNAKAWRARLAGTDIYLAGATAIDLKKLNLDYGTEKMVMMAMDRDSGTLSFHYADMRGCKILGNAENVDFRDADLRGADFSGAENLDKARFNGAKYDASTKWNIDPLKMKAELVTAAPQGSGWLSQGNATPAPKLSHHPLIGNWLILKGEKGATESGSLLLHADGTYDWDYSANAKPIQGKWDEAGDNIIVKAGEKGETWTVKRTKDDEVLLTSDKGTERVGVLDK